MRAFILFMLIAALFVGCRSTNRRINDMGDRKDQPVPEKIIRNIVDVDAGKETAHGMWSGFVWAGTIGLVGGLAALWFTGSWKLLAAGAAIAAVPPVATLFVYPLLPWFSGFALIAGVMLLAYLGWVLWDKIRDNREQDRLRLQGCQCPAPSSSDSEPDSGPAQTPSQE